MADTKTNYVVARSEDGSIQVNFTIAFDEIDEARLKALADLAQDVEIPGFRKGMAPIEKAIEKISKEKILEKTLLGIIPELLAKAIKEEKIKPATYPKIELLKSEENEPWQVRATTCELPKFELPDYKKLITDMAATSEVLKPKVEDGKETPVSREIKINEVIKLLLESVKIVIPKMIVEDEVNARLSNLLARIDKLGLNLENYLGSVGKTPESLREEYEKEAERAITLELTLNEIAQKENIDVSPEKVEEAIKATEKAHGHSHQDDEQEKAIVKSILRRSAVLDSLVALI